MILFLQFIQKIMDNTESEISSDVGSLFSEKSLKLASRQAQKNRYKLNKLNNPKAANYFSGRWSTEQQALYAKFLAQNSKWFVDISIRRNQKVFKLLSEFVVTRSATQCRSHHQKMIKKCGTLNNIIQFIKNPESFQTGLFSKNDILSDTLIKDSKLLEKIPNLNSLQANSGITEALMSQKDPQLDGSPSVDDSFGVGFLSPRLFLEPEKVDFWKLEDLQL